MNRGLSENSAQIGVPLWVLSLIPPGLGSATEVSYEFALQLMPNRETQRPVHEPSMIPGRDESSPDISSLSRLYQESLEDRG